MEINIISLENRKGACLGETKKVRRGYARYLIRMKKALPYDKVELERFNHMRASLEQKETEKLQQAQQNAEKIKALPIVLSSRTADENRLYGSIGSKEIADAITQAGVKVNKQNIHLPAGVIRQIGEYEVIVYLHDQVEITITVRVTSAIA